MLTMEQLAEHDATIRNALAAIERLTWLDSRLRSKAGLNTTVAAERFGVNVKTVRRDLETLRRVVGPTRFRRLSDGTYRQWYSTKG